MSDKKNILAASSRCFESGYTIIEVMMFLAISAVLAVTLLTGLSVQQRRTAFSQAAREAESKINDIANDFITGFTPALAQGCRATSGGGPPTPDSAVTPQGSNYGCTYIGKVIQFQANSENVRIFTVVGRQFRPNSLLPPRDIVEARPAVFVGLTENTRFGYGLRIGGATVDRGGVPENIGAVGFFSSFAQSETGGAGDRLGSGSQTTIVVPIPNSNMGQSEAALISEIEGIFNYTGGYAQLKADYIGRPVRICFLEDNQRAFLDFGDNNQRTATKLTIENGNTC